MKPNVFFSYCAKTTTTPSFDWMNGTQPAQYYARVIADNNGQQSTSSILKFYTCFGAAPTNVTDVVPASGDHFYTTTHNMSVTLQWTLSEWEPSPCGDTVASTAKCDVYLSQSSEAEEVVASGVSCVSKTKQIVVASIGTWFWRVVPTMQGDRLASSPIYTFVVNGCGDGIINETAEECDGGDNCNVDCTCATHWVPATPRGVDCVPQCNDGVVVGSENCDSSIGCSTLNVCSVFPHFIHSFLRG